jgi:hypothetical protein
MSNMTESRLGLNKGGSDNFELFLKQFSGEVLTAFEKRNVMMPLHTVRTITSGKSAQFPMTGRTTASYHTPGDEILGTAIDHSERVINIDNLLVSSAFIANIDEAMNHYDVRSIYSAEMGYALSEHADKALIRTVLAGSFDATDPIGNAGGGSLVVGTSGDTVVQKLLELAQKFDETSIPQGDRYAVVTPATYYAILKAAGGTGAGAGILNRDFGGTATPTRGDQSLMVGGIQVLMSNNIPTANENDDGGGAVDTTLGSTLVRNAPFNDAGIGSAGADEGYSGIDFSNTVGVGFHRSAIGTVKLLDLAVESDYLVQNQGNLMVAKYAMGHNYLRADACVQLKSA